MTFYIDHHIADGEVDCLNYGRPAAVCGIRVACCKTCELHGKPRQHPRTTLEVPA